MNAVILDGRDQSERSDCCDAMDRALDEITVTERDDKRWFKLDEMNILPCHSCGACAHKTPGECVFRDDMPQIMWQIAAAEVLVLVTPIRFGGYSSQLKKVIDKFLLLGMPLYEVKEGHMLHPMRYGEKGILGIGMIEGPKYSNLPEASKLAAQEAFKALIEQSAFNMQCRCDTLIIPETGCDEAIVASHVARMIEKIRKEVDADARE